MELVDQQYRMDESAPSRFEYRKLDTSTSIRILALEPCTDNKPLRGKMQHFDLEYETPIFDALSYVWGAAIYDRSFECDSGIVMITKSLEEALKRLRSPHEVRQIWADGICINQQDVLEREGQVKLMGQLYTRAHAVQIWLGPDPNHAAKRAFDFIMRHVQTSVIWDNYTELRDPAMDWSPLAELSKLEYFKRIWVRENTGTRFADARTVLK
jgi:hypothetical protein